MRKKTKPPLNLKLWQVWEFAAKIRRKYGAVMLTAAIFCLMPFVGCDEKIDGDYYVRLGLAQYESGNYGGALESFTEAQSLKPAKTSLAELYSYIGNTYFQLDDYEKSEANLLQSVAHDPEYFKGWVNLGVIYRKIGDDEKAKDAYLRALELDPENSDSISLYIRLSSLYLSDRKAVSALELLDKAEELYPNLPVIHAYKGLSYAIMSDREKAEYELSLANDYDRIDEIREQVERILSKPARTSVGG